MEPFPRLDQKEYIDYVDQENWISSYTVVYFKHFNTRNHGQRGEYIPSKDETFTLCCFNGGPTSLTVDKY